MNVEEYINSLPDNVTYIDISGKGFTYIPDLSRFKYLKNLYCGNNLLTSLPNLPKRIQYWSLHDNPIYEIIGNHSLNIVRKNIAKINRFRELYYCIKYKNKFREWLWVKVREPLFMKLYSPEYLMNELKDEETDLDEVLNAW